jgi:excisionase family DNA binding protein
MREYIQRLLRQGRLEGVKLGHEWLVYEDSLQSFLTQPRKTGPIGPRKQSLQQHSAVTSPDANEQMGKVSTFRSLPRDSSPLSNTHFNISRDEMISPHPICSVTDTCIYKKRKIAYSLLNYLKYLRILFKNGKIVQDIASDFLFLVFHKGVGYHAIR